MPFQCLEVLLHGVSVASEAAQAGVLDQVVWVMIGVGVRVRARVCVRLGFGLGVGYG